jgi:hypothetical protein
LIRKTFVEFFHRTEQNFLPGIRQEESIYYTEKPACTSGLYSSITAGHLSVTPEKNSCVVSDIS